MEDEHDGPSLRDYVETRFNLLSKQLENVGNRFDEKMREADTRYEQRFKAQIEATAKADLASENRFASVNEFRQTLTDQAMSFLTRNEYFQAHGALIERIGKVENQLSSVNAIDRTSTESVRDTRSNIAVWIAAIMMLLSVVGMLVTFWRK